MPAPGRQNICGFCEFLETFIGRNHHIKKAEWKFLPSSESIQVRGKICIGRSGRKCESVLHVSSRGTELSMLSLKINFSVFLAMVSKLVMAVRI